MFRALISLLLFILSINTWGMEETPSDYLSQYRETASNYPSQYTETFRLSWKIGVLGNWNLQQRNKFAFQFPAIMELQLPVSSPHFKWLLQAGGGLTIDLKTETICDPFFVPDPPKPPFDSEFFRRSYEERLNETTNKDTCSKDRRFYSQFTPFFISQTGFKYGSDVYGILQGGIILSIRGDIGWAGELLIGKELGLDISGGVKTTFFNDSLYVGLVLYLGNAIKSWWVEQSVE